MLREVKNWSWIYIQSWIYTKTQLLLDGQSHIAYEVWSTSINGFDWVVLLTHRHTHRHTYRRLKCVVKHAAKLLTMMAMIPFGFDSTRSQMILLSKYSTGSHCIHQHPRLTSQQLASLSDVLRHNISSFSSSAESHMPQQRYHLVLQGMMLVMLLAGATLLLVQWPVHFYLRIWEVLHDCQL